MTMILSSRQLGVAHLHQPPRPVLLTCHGLLCPVQHWCSPQILQQRANTERKRSIAIGYHNMHGTISNDNLRSNQLHNVRLSRMFVCKVVLRIIDLASALTNPVSFACTIIIGASRSHCETPSRSQTGTGQEAFETNS